VNFLPVNYEDSWTIAKPINIEGIGLHLGEISTVRLFPSKEPGFFLTWSGSSELPIRLSPKQIRESQLCTKLEFGTRSLFTVEHLLSALAGCGLTHICIEVCGEEIPLLDGSALKWVEAINKAGIIKASHSHSPLYPINDPITCYRGSSFITAIPSNKFRLISVIDFPQKVIGKQTFSIELTPESFVKEIAPARTFGFYDQIESLREQGLIKGGGLHNALVCDKDKWINPPLRFENEPVRHKILDLIGDLAIVGFPRAQIFVYRGSHALHADLANKLLSISSDQ
tara:strand:+ start:215 stop:1066 length:852 start_codon:yes stop_codon:yes gene_type:complete